MMTGRSWLRARRTLSQAFMTVMVPCVILSLLYIVLSHSLVDNTRMCLRGLMRCAGLLVMLTIQGELSWRRWGRLQ